MLSFSHMINPTILIQAFANQCFNVAALLNTDVYLEQPQLTLMDDPSSQSSPQQLRDGFGVNQSNISLKGSSVIAGHVSLKPNSANLTQEELEAKSSITTLENGSFAAENTSVLHPSDEGLAAWSYAAGAFAMYIVVWGRL